MRKFWSNGEHAPVMRLMAAMLCICLLSAVVPTRAAASETETTAVTETSETAETTAVTETSETAETTEPTEPTETGETADATDATEETTLETTEETTAETAEEATETTADTQPTEGAVMLTWLDQNGEILDEVHMEAGACLAEENFPVLEQVGWYLCGEDNVTATETPVKAGDEVQQSMVIRAVNRAVMLTLTGECAVGSDVTLTVTLEGFAGEEVNILWQCCPIDEEGEAMGEWTDAEGASGMEYTYTITEDAQNLSWRVIVSVQ